MSGPDHVKRALRNILAERQEPRGERKINMDQTTTISDADIFPPDRPKPELRVVAGIS